MNETRKSCWSKTSQGPSVIMTLKGNNGHLECKKIYGKAKINHKGIQGRMTRAPIVRIIINFRMISLRIYRYRVMKVIALSAYKQYLPPSS